MFMLLKGPGITPPVVSTEMRFLKLLKDGIERYSTDIIVNELQLLGSKPSGEEGRDGGQRNQAQSRSGSNGQNSGRSNGGSNQSARPQQQQSGRPQQQAPAQYAGGGFDGDGGFDPPF